MAFATVHDRYTDEQIARFHEQGLWTDETLFAMIEKQADRQPDKVFGTDSTTEITYGQLRERVLALSVGLRRRGIGPGDRVAVQLPSWTEFFVISAAIARIGAVIVPIMPIYRREEVGFILETASVKAAFTASTYRGFDHARMFADLRADWRLLETIVVVRREGDLVSGAVDFEDLLVDLSREEADAEIGTGVGPDEPFVVVFSSGTTSRPKGCLHTFNTMACGARLLGRGWNYTEADVQFGPSPVTHTTGLVTSYLLPLAHGAASHLMDRWEPKEGLERIAKFKCTACVSATTFLQMLLDVYDPEVHDASSMRFWTSAGAPIPGSFVEAGRAAIPNMAVLSLYGRTENITTTMCTLDDDPSRSVTSDGQALPLQEVAIVDEAGNEVPRGEEGDIAYRGAMNCLEYIGQPDETAANYTPSGFHRSGDLGRMDADGYVRVTGRLKDIVIRGGMNISVRAVEDALASRPDVSQVALVAMPDAYLGEKVCCYLVMHEGQPELTLEEMRDFLLGEGMAIQKVPERLEIVDALPTTATGKIQKHVLRADIAAKLEAGGMAAPRHATSVSAQQAEAV
ncbi:AMP-binding protein [Nocardioides sp. Root151]|uniref:AMP-binding protein n=1 Tax=Nocardioides sp. Root151 TaxID=1736475 RepID=UPI0007039685|nr:AMP-binding protein [Nocardioides sp. Root151]KQZ75697.1 fatty-acid--CoA ligase [Nocardioides sp. Root151]